MRLEYGVLVIAVFLVMLDVVEILTARWPCFLASTIWLLNEMHVA